MPIDIFLANGHEGFPCFDINKNKYKKNKNVEVKWNI